MFSSLRSIFAKIASPPVDESRTFKKQGDEHLKLERLDAAAVCYRRALSTNPDYVDACIGLGFVLSEQKQDGEAEQYLRRALTIDPANADVHYMLGTIARRKDDLIGSIDCYTRALELKPDFAFAYRDLITALLQGQQNQKAKAVLERAISAYAESAELLITLGILLGNERDYDGAAACYRRALSITPGSATTHKSLADALARLGQVDQAAESYQKAIWFEPSFVDAHLGLGSVMQAHGKLDKAIASFRSAIACDPKSVDAHHFLGNALLARGQTQEAVVSFDEVMKLDPENGVKHLIVALSGGDSERAPRNYVENLFDHYADRFDSHLVGVLGYDDPGKLADLLRPHSDTDGEKWKILDLGCGTGLSGVAIAPFARQIVGVDLSGKMLEKARERNLYERLEQLDLLTMMQGEASSNYDVVLSADVFIYVGKLDELVNQARRLLRPGGFFAFSVESLDALMDGGMAPSNPPDLRLNVTGRYAHSKAYLTRMAAHNNFDVLSTTETQSRLDKGKPVQGYLVLWRRP